MGTDRESGLDYRPCRYGAGRLTFRGPKRSLDGSYVAVLGGSETFGRFVARPYPALLEERIGARVVNFGLAHAGLTALHDEAELHDLASRSRLTVIQLPGAQNMSNRLYAVHPRRNDRFLWESAILERLYPEVDFTEVAFTGHLLKSLEARSAERFGQVVDELRLAWVSRMQSLLESISGDKLLLWLSTRRPEDASRRADCAEPMFVDRAMLDRLAPAHAGLVEVVASEAARDEGPEGRVFAPSQSQAAAALPGPVFHAEIAAALAERIAVLEAGNGKRPRGARALAG